MITGNLRETAIEKLSEAGIDRDDARFDIEILEDILVSQGEDAFLAAVDRRCAGEPVAYIAGRKSFYMEEYSVKPGVLIPRSDTEILVEAALRYMGLVDFPMGDIALVEPVISRESVNVIDLCTGTGCVGISIYNAICRAGKKASVTLADVSAIALEVAEDNIAGAVLGEKDDVKVMPFDVLNDDYTCLSGKAVDVIVSNPPYVTDDEMKELPYDVKHYEPELALRADDNGLAFYRKIASEAGKILSGDGALIVEHGYLQGEAVRNIFISNGFGRVMTLKDYGGNDRVTIGRVMSNAG